MNNKNNSKTLESQLLTTLKNRHIVGGGFLGRLEGVYRPDATAWAILALQSSGVGPDELRSSRFRLAEDQQADGRLSFSPDHLEAFWPTSLAILAWNQVSKFQTARDKACEFLLKTTGRHFPKDENTPVAHDPSIRGWPWIADTHSWVIPTSLALIALKAAGYSRHERVVEGMHLLLDRQLPKGGWNYGNTEVYGQKLTPMVETTGVALQALANSIPRQEIDPSLRYLKQYLPKTVTPLSLSWGLLCLGSWYEGPPERESALAVCWHSQGRYGGYDTIDLSLLLLALCLPQGILSLFGPGNEKEDKT